MIAIQGFTNAACSSASYLLSGVKKTAEEGSYALYSLYSLSGFEKTAKAALSTTRAFSYILPDSGLLVSFANTVAAHRDLCCATSIIGSIADFTRIDQLGNKSFSLRDSNGSIDYRNLFLALANICETGKFLQRNELCSFPRCTAFANQCGSMRLLALGETSVTFGDVPVLGALSSSSPKGFFVFIAACIEMHRLRLAGNWDSVNILKCANAMGKIILIFCGKWLKSNRNLLVAGIVLDIITNYTALFAYILKERKARLAR